jgi:hypothetical protein
VVLVELAVLGVVADEEMIDDGHVSKASNNYFNFHAMMEFDDGDASHGFA